MENNETYFRDITKGRWIDVRVQGSGVRGQINK